MFAPKLYKGAVYESRNLAGHMNVNSCLCFGSTNVRLLDSPYRLRMFVIVLPPVLCVLRKKILSIGEHDFWLVRLEYFDFLNLLDCSGFEAALVFVSTRKLFDSIGIDCAEWIFESRAIRTLFRRQTKNE